MWYAVAVGDAFRVMILDATSLRSQVHLVCFVEFLTKLERVHVGKLIKNIMVSSSLLLFLDMLTIISTYPNSF